MSAGVRSGASKSETKPEPQSNKEANDMAADEANGMVPDEANKTPTSGNTTDEARGTRHELQEEPDVRIMWHAV